MTVFVRSATERDLVNVQNLLHRAWHAAYDSIYGAAKVTEITSDWHSLSSLKVNLARPWSEFLLADTGKEIRGLAYARQSSEDFVMLHQLYVEPSHIGQGIGSQLLEECFEAFPEAKAFRLEVDAQNPNAMRFYQRFGFEEISRIANCGKDGSSMPAIVMERRFA
jgi:ribosomal protein S18 acetylase RimI-like enzyme